jgi:uncharacterized protein
MARGEDSGWRINTREFTGHDRDEIRSFPPGEFPRLDPEARVVGAVKARLRSRGSPRGYAGVALAITATLEAQCQRCMRPVRLTVDATVNVEFGGGSPGPDDLPDAWESVEHADQFDVLHLVEDELLLALPVAPKHGDCRADGATQAGEKVLPFAALAGWQRGAR